jgi:hypothetical protein
MEVLLLLVMGLTNIFCFMIGAKVGQAVTKGETVQLPNPAKAVREHKARKAADEDKNRYDTILRNIDNYDGTGIGQEEIPR